MRQQLTAAWQLRRVLLIGGADAQTLYTKALLAALGARCVPLPPSADARMLSRVLCQGRTGAVILPSAHALAPGGLKAQLGALTRILHELREAGVPLCLLCSHEDVYSPGGDAWQAEETAPLGGSTREGLIQSILQLYASGVSRGLLGDAVTTVVCRHAPCLGSGHESVRQASAWCRAILRGETPVVEHAAAQGTFMHPLDAALGALCAGAHVLQGGAPGAFNIAPAPHNCCANRSAYGFLAASEGADRAARETAPPCAAPSSPLSGAKLRRLCGFSPLLGAKEALSFLMAHERALTVGEEAAALLRIEQAEQFLARLP